MNALAVAALLLLAAAQDPRAFRMPEKPVEPPKAEQPAQQELPEASAPLPAKPAESETAPAPAPEPEAAPASAPEPVSEPEPAPPPAPTAAPQKPLMFELPKPASKNEAAAATGHGPRATQPATQPATLEPATPERAAPRFTLPNQPPRQRKPKAPRPFRLPEKNDVSN